MPEYQLYCFAQSGNSYKVALMLSLVGADWAPIEKQLAATGFIVGSTATIADISMCGYLFYPAHELWFDPAAEYPAIAAWLDRIRALPRWAHPHDLMPGHPLPDA